MATQATQQRAARGRAAPAAAIDPVTVEVIRGAMETVAYEMATHVSLVGHHADPEPEQRAQRDHPRRARRAGGALGRDPAVHALLDPARALRARVLQGGGAERRRRAGRQRSLPRRRPPAGLQRLRAGGGGRRAGADRLDPVSPRRHRRRHARRLQRRGDRHLGGGRALPRAQALRPRRRAPRPHLHAEGEQPHADLHRRPARAGRRGPARREAPEGDHRALRRPRREGGRRSLDRVRGAPLPRGGGVLAGRQSTRRTPGSTTIRSAIRTSTSTSR